MVIFNVIAIAVLIFCGPVTGEVQEQTEASGRQNVPEKELSPHEKTISGVRELDFLRPVKYVKMDSAGLKSFLNKKIDEEMPPEKFFNELSAYKALGLIDDVSGIRELLIELYLEQGAGFYDHETDRVITNKDNQLSNALSDIVFIHELTHVLQDQHFDLDKLMEEVKDNNDRQMALISLVEGDASLAHSNYMINQRDWKLKDVFGFAFHGQEKFYSAPYVVRENLIFPYTKGLKFVSRLQHGGGWEEVNRAYRDLPVSSEQILHPEKYLDQRDDPRDVSIPDMAPVLGAGWKLLSENNLGELNTRILFRRHLGGWRAKKPSRGWDGDWYNYYGNAKSGRQALIWYTVWDSDRDAAEFFNSYRRLVKKKSKRLKPINLEEGEDSVVWKYKYKTVFLGKRGDKAVVIEVPRAELLEPVLDRLGGFSFSGGTKLKNKKDKP